VRWLVVDGIQTTLRMGSAPKLEEFKKENAGPLRYMLEKYKVWKELKEKEKGKGGDFGISKLATF